jgi:nicotinate-nucleotide adenylyltransferase
MKIGLFGGSFDPVHLGHLLAARTAVEELGLDRLFFIPAAQSPFKLDSQHAPATARLRWLRLALAGRPECEVDDQEIRRGGVSFSIETLRDYARRFPSAGLFYLIGADNAAAGRRGGAVPAAFPRPHLGGLSARGLLLPNPLPPPGRPAG